MSAADDQSGKGAAPPLPGAGPAKQVGAALPTPDAPPYRLLWSLGTAAIVLGIIAFALWVTNGGVVLFDMMVALCL